MRSHSPLAGASMGASSILPEEGTRGVMFGSARTYVRRQRFAPGRQESAASAHLLACRPQRPAAL